MTDTSSPIMQARLLILALAVLGWAILWCARFLPVSIKGERASKLVGTGIGAGWFLTLALQVRLYRSMTGIRGWDRFLWIAYLGECTVAVLVARSSMTALGRKKARRAGAGILEGHGQ
jgi:hypothetical protein